ncbi:Mannose-6-phosphate isomerase [Podochytrium sp. JEL0797]|nr:Mannose-6-phosphate isomerase [Podochytrium sp. JEL0797]
MDFSRLRVKTQSYEWGRFGMASKAGELASADPTFTADPETPYAELWMGTHPNAPSLVWDTLAPLKSVLDEHNLGAGVSARFGGDLPFLFKVLSIGKALSIQAHPDKTRAAALFQEHPTVYKDPNHKPEMAIALTDFEALIGFRPLPEIVSHLAHFPELAKSLPTATVTSFTTTPTTATLKSLFESLMTSPPATIAVQIRSLVSRLKITGPHAVGSIEELLVRLDSQFPDDVGVFCALLLNFVTLREGEGIYLAANEPHAYLSGDCVECMAASDNVVRSGLTPKFKDVTTLVDMLTYNHGPADSQILKGDAYNNGTTSLLYDPPIEEFSIVRTKLAAGGVEGFDGVAGPSVVIVTSGGGKVVVKGVEHEAGLGFVFFVGAGVEVTVKGEGAEGVTMYRAFCV